MQKRILGASLAAAVVFVIGCTGTASASLIKALRLQVAGTPMTVSSSIVGSSSNLTVSNAFWSLGVLGKLSVRPDRPEQQGQKRLHPAR